MNEKFPTLHVVNHPLVQHKLTVMRDKNTSVKDFRTLVGEIAMLLTYEATRDLPTTLKTIETPLCTCEMPVLAGKKMAIVPILRAGLGFEDGILNLIPSARVAHIGMYRDEETLEPHFYFLKYRRQRRHGHHQNEGAGLQKHQADDPGGRSRGRAVHLRPSPRRGDLLRRAGRPSERKRLHRARFGRRRRPDLRHKVKIALYSFADPSYN